MSQRRVFSSDFKVQVVLEVLSGRRLAEVCREHQLKYDVVVRWKNQFLQNAPRLFQMEAPAQADQARIAELERLIGRLTMELEIAKKVSAMLNGHGRPSGS